MTTKQFLLTFLACLLALLVVGLILAGLAWWWWNTPLADPIHIDKGALPSDYTGYWKYFWWLAGAGFVYLTAIVGLLIGILRQMRR